MNKKKQLKLVLEECFDYSKAWTTKVKRVSNRIYQILTLLTPIETTE